MRFYLTGVAAVAAAAISSPAVAAWNVAQSRHFIIYSNDSAKNLQSFASELERFDSAVRYSIRMDDPPIGNGNRLTVFVLPSVKDVRSMMGDTTGFYAGFYTGRVAGSLAYVPKEMNDSLDDNSIFFHEYTHHLMQQQLDRPYPQWYSEGFAEFFSTPKFDRDGSVLLGRIVKNRAYGLLNGPKLPLDTLLNGMKPNMTNEQRDVFYGRGWLLTHYLQLEDRRHGQLQTYLNAMYKGASSIDAAHQAFGDLTQLDKELNVYETKPLMQLKIPASAIHDQPIAVTPLSAAASQIVLPLARIDLGEEKADAAEATAAQVRAVEARFPGDELVETTLAKAELKTGHAAAAEKAAERAIAADPKNPEALVLKGEAMSEAAAEIHDASRHAMFEQARQALIAANKLDTEDPEPLFEYYRTFIREGVRPTPNALAALHYASDLAPQDLGVRMSSAVAYLNEGKPADARSALTVVAYSPHGQQVGDLARRMIADIDSGTPRAALLELRSGPRPQSASTN